ncbi:metallophosphoesterase [Jannaschia aquimarina]|uniref:CpdA protein n=1 Tax=Jannaschia aquimarina TaxID=935700 RepID=A0A0D1EDM3_9RHOB|nr:metallophosphoesterase [Jannaschia aquimarina]KIT15046.1 3',5'-cyclic adenosine monophosphate phosphodiesterase CpdA [Jannaschia aquimarina]SNS62721.1 3',5'-cyclic AMP phosphodiesterase CpdA [Jannaschia aquimarina]
MLIAQLTDLHVLADGAPAYGRVDTLGHLRRAVDHLNALPLDGVIITGDLVEDSSADSYATLRPELDRLAAPWWPIPGNHDGPAFWDVFDDRMTDPAREIGHVVDLPGLRLVLLDTRVEGDPFGRVDAARAGWLAEALDADLPTLLAMHHPPIRTGIAHMDRIGLEDLDALTAALQPRPPHAILCGHAHRTIQGRLGGVPVLVAPSSADAVALHLETDAPPAFALEPPGVLLHLMDGAELVTHLSHIGPYPEPRAAHETDQGSAHGA